MALHAKGEKIAEAVPAAPAQWAQMVNFEPAIGRPAILAGVVIAPKGRVAELAPLAAPSFPAAMLAAETVLCIAGNESVVALRVSAFDLVGSGGFHLWPLL